MSSGHNSPLPSSSVEEQPSTPLSPAKKLDLLHRARRHRLHWVLQARDHRQTETTVLPATNINLDDLPGARCMQEVLTFFNEVVNDGEDLDLDSLLLSIQEEYRAEEDEARELDILLSTWKAASSSASSSSSSSYDLFLQKLLHPQAVPLVKSMQQFCTKFIATFRHQRANTELHSLLPHASKSHDDEHKQRAQQIWTFLDHCLEMMKETPLWKDETKEQLEESLQHCEKFVFTKLYPVLFATDSEDHAKHQQTFERIGTLSFISAEHLDIKSLHQVSADPKPENASKQHGKQSEDPVYRILLPAIESIQDLSRTSCPQDKLQCLRKCSSSIAQALKDCRKDGKLPGADELLPMMILCVKFSNPPYIHAQIKFLQRYTRPQKLVSEAGYLITNFVSAVFFLENVDAAALTIQPEAFEQAIKAAKQRAKDRIQQQTKDLLDMGKKGRVKGLDEEEDDDEEEGNSLNYEKLLNSFQYQVAYNAKKEFISIQELKQQYWTTPYSPPSNTVTGSSSNKATKKKK